MKKVKIIGYASDICWWHGYLGEVCEVIDYYEPTNYVRIILIYRERFFEDQPYPKKGWIPMEYVEIIE